MTPGRRPGSRGGVVVIGVALGAGLVDDRLRWEPATVEGTIYDAVGGLPALLRLAEAWHERCLADPVVAHAFSHGYHPDHSARLAAYWAEALGGPSAYTATVTSESEVVRLHSGNGEHREMDERAVACFDAAVSDAGLDLDPALHDTLVGYFTWATGYQIGRAHV